MSSLRSGRSPQSLHLPSHQHESSLQASVPPKPGSEPCQSPAKQRTPSAGHPQRLLDLIPTRIDHLWSWHTTGNRVHRLPGKWIRALLSKKHECPAWSWSRFTGTAPRLSGLRGLDVRNAGAGQRRSHKNQVAISGCSLLQLLICFNKHFLALPGWKPGSRRSVPDS